MNKLEALLVQPHNKSFAMKRLNGSEPKCYNLTVEIRIGDLLIL